MVIIKTDYLCSKCGLSFDSEKLAEKHESMLISGDELPKGFVFNDKNKFDNGVLIIIEKSGFPYCDATHRAYYNCAGIIYSRSKEKILNIQQLWEVSMPRHFNKEILLSNSEIEILKILTSKDSRCKNLFNELNIETLTNEL